MPERDDHDRMDESITRAQGDLVHDNFVPRYSALADAEPSPIILVGVWLLFAPPVLFSPIVAYVFVSAFDGASAMQALVIGVCALVDAIGVAILLKMTHRYLKDRKQKLTHG